jgi:hypothetical protein
MSARSWPGGCTTAHRWGQRAVRCMHHIAAGPLQCLPAALPAGRGHSGCGCSSNSHVRCCPADQRVFHGHCPVDGPLVLGRPRLHERAAGRSEPCQLQPAERADERNGRWAQGVCVGGGGQWVVHGCAQGQCMQGRSCAYMWHIQIEGRVALKACGGGGCAVLLRHYSCLCG